MTAAADLLGPDGPLAAALPGFEFREGQVEMAARVEEALRRGGTLFVEAGTGIGKSFAYLLPALLSEERIVVSTATKALQDQLFEKDLPTLQEILGTRVRALRVKGRENYLCRLEWARFGEGQTPWAVPSATRDRDLRRIARWARTTRTGDRDEIPGIEGPLDFWRRISTVAENCIGKVCPEYDECHLTRLRRQVQRSRLLIVNHHLLVADRLVRQNGYGRILGDYEHVIVDEAHRLEAAATHSLSVTLTSGAARRLTTEVSRFWKQDVPGKRPPAAAGRLRRRWERLFDGLPRGAPGEATAFDPLALPETAMEARAAAQSDLEALDSALGEVGEGLRAPAARSAEADPPADPKAGADRLRVKVQDLRDDLEMLFAPREDFVHWTRAPARQGAAARRLPLGAAGRRRGPGAALLATVAPIHPGGLLPELLFDSLQSCVLTSATLAVDGGFSHVAEELGVSATEEATIPSPFRYEEQAGLFVPRGAPAPTGPRFAEAVADQVLELVTASRGRALVLFTSWANLERVFRRLDGRCPYPLLRQERGAGSQRRLAEFRRRGNAVLLGVRSFWEGVDLPGEDLTLLVIDKLPFPVPTDPLQRARQARAQERTGNGFVRYSVPLTALALKQGVGRLIRSSSDRGLAVVFDSRLKTRSYGRRILDSLPPFRRIEDAAEAVRFLEELP